MRFALLFLNIFLSHICFASESVSTKEEDLSLRYFQLNREEDVNINHFPESRTHRHHSEVFIGDLHGSAQKMLFFLIREGAVALGARSYKAFVDLYNNPKIGFKHFEQFKTIVDRMTLGPSTGSKFIFLGDTLADRGVCDAITLLIYRKIHDLGINFRVILSNHDSSFLRNVIAGKFTRGEIHSNLNNKNAQCKSMLNLAKWLKEAQHMEESKDGSECSFGDFIDKAINEAYIPHLNLFYLTYFDVTFELTGGLIATHAPMPSLKIVEDFYEYYEIAEGTDLIDGLNQINSSFRDWLLDASEAEGHQTLWNDIESPDGPRFKLSALIAYIAHIRRECFSSWGVEDERACYKGGIDEDPDSALFFVHSHDEDNIEEDPLRSHVFNLERENKLHYVRSPGRPPFTYINEGRYTVLVVYDVY